MSGYAREKDEPLIAHHGADFRAPVRWREGFGNNPKPSFSLYCISTSLPILRVINILQNEIEKKGLWYV